MKKVGLLFSVIVLIMLAGCGVQNLNFEGEERKIEHIEDMLEAKLIEENQGHDEIDVEITVGIED
jgi:hypothetical protein